MAECFCGCGRQVRFSDRKKNQNGAKTLDARVRLSDEYEHVLGEGPLVEHGADPDEWQLAVDGMRDRIRLGQDFEELWARCVHGEGLLLPGEAARIKREWSEWLEQVTRVTAMLADGRREAERLRSVTPSDDSP